MLLFTFCCLLCVFLVKCAVYVAASASSAARPGVDTVWLLSAFQQKPCYVDDSALLAALHERIQILPAIWRYLLLQHPDTGCPSKYFLDACRCAIGLGQADDIVLNLKPAKQSLKQRDDVLLQQPLAASPHFFSLKASDPTDHETVPVPGRIAPAPYRNPMPTTRAHVSGSDTL